MDISRRKLLSGLLVAPALVPAFSLLKTAEASSGSDLSLAARNHIKWIQVTSSVKLPEGINVSYMDYNYDSVYDSDRFLYNFRMRDDKDWFPLACSHEIGTCHLDHTDYAYWKRELYWSLRVSLHSHVHDHETKRFPEKEYRVGKMRKILDEISWLENPDGSRFNFSQNRTTKP